jgi:hypothetical protein
MPSDKQLSLRKNIRRLTKRIGQALKAHDHNEVSNLRRQRGDFIKTLIEEFDEYFILQDSKSCFVTLEEAKDHYENPKNRQSVATARVVSEMYQGREFLRKRHKKFSDMSLEELRDKVLEEISGQMNRMEKLMNKMLTDIGKPAIDFIEADKSKQDDDSFLDGFDMSSLD